MREKFRGSIHHILRRFTMKDKRYAIWKRKNDKNRKDKDNRYIRSERHG